MFQTSIPKVERNFNKDLTVCWTSPSGCVLGMSVSVCLQMDCLHPYICSSPLFPVPWNSSATLSVAQTFGSFPPMYTVYHQAPLIVTQTCLSVPLPFSEPLATTPVLATSMSCFNYLKGFIVCPPPPNFAPHHSAPQFLNSEESVAKILENQ